MLHIRVKDLSVPDIYLSDRRCVIGSQQYLPRVLSLGEPGSNVILTQDIRGRADNVRFMLGNADRVMSEFVIDTALKYASIDLSLYHVPTGIVLQLWKGIVTDFQSDGTANFPLTCSDGLYPITQNYPRRSVTRQCWKTFNDGIHCPWQAVTGGLIGNPSSCDYGFDTANGCLSHGMAGSPTNSAYFGAHPQFPQSFLVRDPGTGIQTPFGPALAQVVTSTSIVSDSVYGQPLPDIWCNDYGNPLNSYPANCLIMAVQDESGFEDVLGIVGAGPLGLFAPYAILLTSDGYPVIISPLADGNLPFGVTVNQQETVLHFAPGFGTREIYGDDPIPLSQGTNAFSLGLDGGIVNVVSGAGGPGGGPRFDVPNPPYPAGGGGFSNQITGVADDIFPVAAGTAFCEIIYTKGSNQALAPTLAESHSMQVPVSLGLPGSQWDASGVYSTTQGLVDPFWVLANTFLRALGLDSAAPSDQLAVLNLPTFTNSAGTGASDISSTIVVPLIGTATTNPVYARTPAGALVHGTLNNLTQLFSYWPISIGWPPPLVGAPPTVTPPSTMSLSDAVTAGYLIVTTGGGLVPEVQFQFQGTINQRKPFRDWGIEILNCALGYFWFDFGKLSVGCRYDAVPTSAFTPGNILYMSLSLKPPTESLFGGPTDIEYLKIFFADTNLQFQENFAEYEDKDHEAFMGRPGAPLSSQIRSVGGSTLSQMLRVAITRQREETGGTLRPDLPTASQYIEWSNYLEATWKSTILSLPVGVGQVVSLTNGPGQSAGAPVATYPGPEPPLSGPYPPNSNPPGPFPANTWPYRVTSWTLHQDWSITLKGRSVTDSMYNVDVGPQVQPTPPAPGSVLIYPETLGQWAPFEVQADAADAMYPAEWTFDLEQIYTTGAAGPIATAVATGVLPVSQFISSCPAPNIQIGQVAYTSTGGQIPGGTVLYVQVFATNAAGQYSPPSQVLVITTPPGGSTWEFTLSHIQWPNIAGLTGFTICVGTQPDLICAQTTGALTGSAPNYGPTSLTIGYAASVSHPSGQPFARSSYAVGNLATKQVKLKGQHLVHGGVEGGSVTGITSTSISVHDSIDVTGADNWSGRKLAIIGRYVENAGGVTGYTSHGGTLFVPGDTVQVLELSATSPCVITIDTVSVGGVPTSSHISSEGSGFVPASGLSTIALTGIGVGYIVNVTSVLSASSPFQAFNITGFTPSTGTCTLDRNPISAGVLLADELVICFLGYDNSSNPYQLTDTGLINVQNAHNGEVPNSAYLQGLYALVISGTNRGASAKIIGNGQTYYTLATPLLIDATSVWIIVSPAWTNINEVDVSGNADPAKSTQIQLPIENYLGSGLWIEAVTVDTNGVESSSVDAPGRMLWVIGQAGGNSWGAKVLTYTSTITPDYTNGATQYVELTGNVHFNAIINPPSGAGQPFDLVIVQDSVGNHSVTWDASYGPFGGFGIVPGNPGLLPTAQTRYEFSQFTTPGEWILKNAESTL
jgi:hypothetical protein